MEPLRGTNLGVAEVDFKPQEVPAKSVHTDSISTSLMKLKMTASNTFHTRRLFFKSPKSTTLYANVKILSVAP